MSGKITTETTKITEATETAETAETAKVTEKSDTEQHSEIFVYELQPGMYVLSISFQDNSVSVKTEGYVLSTEKINRLINAGIRRVIIDPSKTKQVEQIDKVLSDFPLDNTPDLISDTSPAPDTAPAIDNPVPDQPHSLAPDMGYAHAEYDDAKNLQNKIFSAIKAGNNIDLTDVRKTTDDMVTSVFNNQDALLCMAKLRSKGSYLIEHALNCAILMAVFAKHLQIPAEIIKELVLGAFIHDVGKVFISNKILNKPGLLTEAEFNLIKSHVALGLKALESTPGISHIAITMIREHHERLDGSGYPKMLTTNEISKYGRMMAIIDSYDAMTAERVYKTCMHPVNAFKALVNESPVFYDEELVESFIECLGVYPVGTLVKLNSGKIGLISELNKHKPLHPYVRVFYNTRLNQTIPIEQINLCKSKYKDQIDSCVRPEEFDLDLLTFFKAAFID